MCDPRLPAARVRKTIAVRHALVFRDVLPGLQVPPHIGVTDIARGHAEQAKENDCEKDAVGAKQPADEDSIINSTTSKSSMKSRKNSWARFRRGAGRCPTSIRLLKRSSFCRLLSCR